jgi:ribosomal protein S27AE
MDCRTLKFCPNCDEELLLAEGQNQITCPNEHECGKTYSVSYDADFDGELWHALVTLTEI